MTSFVLEALTSWGKFRGRGLLFGLARLDEHRRGNSDCWTPALCSVVSTAREDVDLAAWKLDVRSVLRRAISERREEDQKESVMAIDSSYGAMPHSFAEVLVNAVLMMVFSLLGGLGTLLWRRVSGSSPRRDKMARAAAEIEAILAEM
jgi:hypothetical protein